MSEDLLSGLCEDLSVTGAPCAATVSAARFEHLRGGKNAATKPPVRQELRRRTFLERQKEKRYDALLHARGLATGVFPVEPRTKQQGEKNGKNVDMDSESESDADGEATRPRKPPRSYRNQLMQSEWLVEVPPDLDRYIVMPCPKGKRGLLVASRGVTKLYARNGFHFTTFVSNLPGGSRLSPRQSNWKANEFTILDVVYSEPLKTCFVLDLIFWRSKPYYDSATSFRLYWLKTQFDECAKELTSIERKVKFEVVPFYAWEPEKIKALLCCDRPPFVAPVEIDGILFYHPDGHYIPGICPLVGWLKPYMLPEVLNMEVHPRSLLERPSEYVNLKEKLATRDRDRKATAVEMDSGDNC